MQSRKTKVLAFCLSNIPSAKVGVISPLENIVSRGLNEFKFLETLKVTKKDIAEADVIICIRGSERIEYEIIKESRKLGKYIIYFLDDDLLNVPDTAECFQYFNNSSVKNNIYSIMKLCHCLWTTNKNIENLYETYYEKSVLINSPALLLQENNEVTNVQKKDKTVIGFAGGVDHSKFLDKILDKVIDEILKFYGDKVQFEFFGSKPKLVEKYNLIYIPYKNDYEEYKKTIKMRRWDIGLAPLENSRFHSCKYFNKFLEYGALEVAGIYSNVEPFIFIIENEKNGLLANNDIDSWVNCLKNLIDNPEKIVEISKNANNQLKNEFALEKIGDSIIQKIPQITNYLSTNCSEKDVKILNRNQNYYLYKIVNVFKREGGHAFIYICKKILEKIRIGREF